MSSDQIGHNQFIKCAWLLESVHTVLTQPGTPVSFQGMCIYLLFDFRKLQNFRCFPRFLYYVITLISCLHLSLVTPSAVVSTSLSLDLQFPFALLYCFRLCNSDPLLCTRYKLVPFLSYKYLYSVPRSPELRLLLFSSSRLTRSLLIISTRYLFPDPEIPESRIPTLSHTQKSGIPEGFHREQGNTLSLPR